MLNCELSELACAVIFELNFLLNYYTDELMSVFFFFSVNIAMNRSKGKQSSVCREIREKEMWWENKLKEISLLTGPRCQTLWVCWKVVTVTIFCRVLLLDTWRFRYLHSLKGQKDLFLYKGRVCQCVQSFKSSYTAQAPTDIYAHLSLCKVSASIYILVFPFF